MPEQNSGGPIGVTATVALVVAALAAVGVSGDYVPRLVRDQPDAVSNVMRFALVGTALIAVAVALGPVKSSDKGKWILPGVGLVGAIVVLITAFVAVGLGTDSVSDREQPRAVLSAATAGDLVTISVDVHGSSLTPSEDMLVQVIGLKTVSNTLSGNEGLCIGSRLGRELKPEEGTVLAWERLGPDNKGNASGTVKVEATRDEFQGVCAFGALANKRDVGRATAKNARWAVAYLRL